ncbi:hypothetical protein D0Z03_001841 [Geotrichum reessii]|nr:hypothetical protein D0Z03_001841 [Galactomyces reessii]
MIIPKSYLVASLLASLAKAQEWGNFSGQVDSVEYVSENVYSLTSDITVSLAEGWSFVDLIGRNEGQISNKTIVYNSADAKYYGKLAFIDTATSDTADEVCFPSVPIRISLNQQTDGSTSGRLINGNIFIGCIGKSRIESYPTASTSSTAHAASETQSVTTAVTTSDAATKDSTSTSVLVSSESTTPSLSTHSSSEVLSATTTVATSDVVSASTSESVALSSSDISSISVHYSTVAETTSMVHLPILTGAHSNNTLITSYAPTSTHVKNFTTTGVANFTGTGIVINQNSGATNSITSMLTLGAVMMCFVLIV